MRGARPRRRPRRARAARRGLRLEHEPTRAAAPDDRPSRRRCGSGSRTCSGRSTRPGEEPRRDRAGAGALLDAAAHRCEEARCGPASARAGEATAANLAAPLRARRARSRRRSDAAHLLPGARIAHRTRARSSSTSAEPDRNLPYMLTEVAAAPPGVPGPFRLVSASPSADRRRAQRRAARLPQARAARGPAPLPARQARRGARPARRHPGRRSAARELTPAVRIRRLLALDLVAAEPGGALARLPECGGLRRHRRPRRLPGARARVRGAACDEPRRAARGKKIARAAVVAARTRKKQIASLPRVAVRFAEPGDPDARLRGDLLVAAWRDLGLGPYFGRGRPDARFERVLAAYPRRGRDPRRGSRQAGHPDRLGGRREARVSRASAAGARTSSAPSTTRGSDSGARAGPGDVEARGRDARDEHAVRVALVVEGALVHEHRLARQPGQLGRAARARRR